LTEKELFMTYREDIYRTCYYMLQHSADAEDVCQEVFITVFRYDWRQVQYLKTWLMRVAVNRCLNHLNQQSRLKRKESRLRLHAVPRTEKAAETVVEEQESQQECAQLLLSLPPKLRAVVSLRYLSEYSLNEISDVLELPLGTVKSRLNKAAKILKKLAESQLEARGEQHGPYRQREFNV
jgi:RNA polymerase sigma factor (sigma-70 family)